MGIRNKEIKPLSFINTSDWRETNEELLGTRDKYKLINPKEESKTFMLKLSKEGAPFEFWSEVIASKYGQMLGIKVTNYEVGYRLGEIQQIGSLCYFEFNEKTNFFYHGTHILNHFCKEFEELSKNSKISKKGDELLSHSFQDIKNALTLIEKSRLLDSFFKMFIFDALIGNTDRHTDNWAILSANRNIKLISDLEKKFSDPEIGKKIDNPDKNINSALIMMVVLLLFSLIAIHYLDDKNQKKKHKGNRSIKKDNKPKDGRWSMCNLYDSSSSLGWRESEEAIIRILNKENGIENYINKGLQEIKWESSKLSHFDFLCKVREKYKRRMDKIIHEIIQRYETIQVENFVDSIDMDLPLEFENYKLSSSRKEFIKKQLMARMENLKKIVKWESSQKQ